jgi:hypothetical protein
LHLKSLDNEEDYGIMKPNFSETESLNALLIENGMSHRILYKECTARECTYFHMRSSVKVKGKVPVLYLSTTPLRYIGGVEV